MSFAKAPFVFITSLLVAGILIWDISNWNVDSSFIVSFIAIFLFVVMEKWKNESIRKIRSGLLFITLISTGGGLVKSYRTEPEKISKGASVVLTIDEIAPEDRDWRKSVCQINSIVTSEKIDHHNEKVLLFFNSPNVQKGDILLVHTDLEQIKNKNNPGEFDLKAYWNNKDIYQIGFVGETDYKLLNTVDQNWWSGWNESLRAALKLQLQKVLKGDELGVAMALLLGDKQLLSQEVRSSFSHAGAMHVLAVSGLHVGIVLVILMFVFSRFTLFVSKKRAILLSILIIWIYAGVTGFSPSVLRASFMFTMLAIAQISGRIKNPINVLFCSAFVLLIFNPLWIYDIGFQLSYLAMIGIYLFYKPISGFLYFRNKWIRKIWEGTAVGFAAQLLTFPLTLFYFHQFPNYFVITNLGMMVFAGMLLGIGLFYFAINWSAFLTLVVGNVLKFGLLSMLFFVQWIDLLPFSVATGFDFSLGLVIALYCIILMQVLIRTKFMSKIVLAAGLISFLWIQYNRYDRMNLSELVVFNAPDFAMVIKIKNRIVCLHNAKIERIKNVESIANDYCLVRPGELEFVYLGEGETTVDVGGNKFTLLSNKYGVEVLNDSVKLYVRTNYSGNYIEVDKIMDMGYLAKNEDRYNLHDGAMAISLK